jgi:putative transposase
VKPACCVIRSKPVRTKISDKATLCPLDHANCQFDTQASNLLWLSDFTCFSKRSGFGHVAFVIDA